MLTLAPLQFIFAEIVAEVPYLLVCALLYFACWYAVVGLSFAPGVAGPVYLQMTLYEFLYTGIGQFVASYAPNATFAALVNPLLIGVLVSFSGVLTPYSQITVFWRYWLCKALFSLQKAFAESGGLLESLGSYLITR